MSLCSYLRCRRPGSVILIPTQVQVAHLRESHWAQIRQTSMCQATISPSLPREGLPAVPIRQCIIAPFEEVPLCLLLESLYLLFPGWRPHVPEDIRHVQVLLASSQHLDTLSTGCWVKGLASASLPELGPRSLVKVSEGPQFEVLNFLVSFFLSN